MKIRINADVDMIMNILVTVGNGFSFESDNIYDISEEQKEILDNYNIQYDVLDI